MATRITATPSSISFKSASDKAVQLAIKDEAGNAVTNAPTLKYSSDNHAVATVTDKGLVSPAGPGSCSVKAEASDKSTVTVSVPVSVGA